MSQVYIVQVNFLGVCGTSPGIGGVCGGNDRHATATNGRAPYVGHVGAVNQVVTAVGGGTEENLEGCVETVREGTRSIHPTENATDGAQEFRRGGCYKGPAVG